MNSDSNSDDLDSGVVDYSVALARGATGLVPIVGPLLAEIIGVTIPNQRLDRVAKFSEELERRLNEVEKCLLESKLHDDDFTDLIEEGVRQATRSLSDERRSYIASLIANGLTSENVDRSESKHLLRILGEINDVEVVWLRFYREPHIGGDETFRETHEKVLKPVIATFGASQDILNKDTLQKSYKEHLCQLGLLERRHRIDRKTGLPEFDRSTGSMKEWGFQITSLGRLLLNEIGLSEENSSK